MKYYIHITTPPLSDRELVEAAVLILKLADVPLKTKAQALRDLIPLLPISQFEAGQRGHHDRAPLLKGPLDPEPGLDKVWRLVWQSHA
jgi:hypothetical protein